MYVRAHRVPLISNGAGQGHPLGYVVGQQAELEWDAVFHAHTCVRAGNVAQDHLGGLVIDPARPLQECLCLPGIVRIPSDIWVIGPRLGHDGTVDNQAISPQHAIDQRLPVQGIEQRLTHPSILEKRHIIAAQVEKNQAVPR